MARLCERPGCARPGEVRYGVEHEQLLVWLDATERVADGVGGMLCRRHADSMVVPVGWTLDDRREPMPRLFRAPVPDVPAPAEVPRRRPRVKTEPAAEQLDLTDELERPVWAPVFDQQDDLDGLLRPQTPLLARAFQQRDRRRD